MKLSEQINQVLENIAMWEWEYYAADPHFSLEESDKNLEFYGHRLEVLLKEVDRLEELHSRALDEINL